MPPPEGQGVTPPAAAPGAGTPPVGTPPAGTPPAGSPPAGSPPAGAPPVTDQQIEITVPGTGEKIKVNLSDILDESGVLYKNRAAEASRRAAEAEGRPPAGAPPAEEYSEDDLNRMMMTGEGVKALQIIMNKNNVSKVVGDVLSAREMKVEAGRRYPDLKNPNTEFFRRVANYMTSRNLYDHPEGLILAGARVAEDMRLEGRPFTEGARGGSPEAQRGSQHAAGVVPGGGGGTPPVTTPELDEAGKKIANKLGVDPAKMAARLNNYLANKGKPKEGRE